PWGVESATVLCDGAVVEPVERFLAHLTSIERSPNTVRAYAHDLRDFFTSQRRPRASRNAKKSRRSRPRSARLLRVPGCAGSALGRVGAGNSGAVMPASSVRARRWVGRVSARGGSVGA